MLLDILIAISCGGGGLVCGWVMHGLHKSVMFDAPQTPSDATSADSGSPAEAPRLSQERLTKTASNLQKYAVSMAADVGVHQNKVEAFQTTLVEQTGVEFPNELVEDLNELVAANELMQRQLQSAQDRIHEQAIQLETAEMRAQTDALTRVANRRAFDEKLEKCHKEGARATGALMILDVDHFKQFNDVYGHRAGDEVLRVVAGVLNARLQPFGLVARFGGEEFAVLLDLEPGEDALMRLEEARLAVCQREILFEDQCLRVTACIGVAFLNDGESRDEWLQRADDALYHSKANGRDCGHWMNGEKPVKIQSGRRTKSRSATKSDRDVAATTKPQRSSKPKTEDAGSENPSSAHAKSNGPGSNSSSTDAAKATSNDASSSKEPADKPAKPASMPKVDAFAYLPDAVALQDVYDELHRRSEAMAMQTHLLAIRFNGEPSSFRMRSLLQVVRASSRNVDRIGCDGNQTLLMLMPSADDATSQGRAEQIHASAQALRLVAETGEASPVHPVSIGRIHSGQTANFKGMVSNAVRTAEQAADASSDAVQAFGGATATV